MPAIRPLNRIRNFFELQKLNNKRISAKALDDQLQLIIDYLNNITIPYIQNFIDTNTIASVNPNDRETFFIDDGYTEDDEHQHIKLNKLTDLNFSNSSINPLTIFAIPNECSVLTTNENGNLQWLPFVEDGLVLCFDNIDGVCKPIARKIDNDLIDNNSITGNKIFDKTITADKFTADAFAILPEKNSISRRNFKQYGLKNDNIIDGAIDNLPIFTGDTDNGFYYWLSCLRNNIIDNTVFFASSELNIKYRYDIDNRSSMQVNQEYKQQKIPFLRENLDKDFMLEKRHFGYVPPPDNVQEDATMRFIFDGFSITKNSLSPRIMQDNILLSNTLHTISGTQQIDRLTVNKVNCIKQLTTIINDDTIHFNNLQPKLQKLLYEAGARW